MDGQILEHCVMEKLCSGWSEVGIQAQFFFFVSGKVVTHI